MNVSNNVEIEFFKHYSQRERPSFREAGLSEGESACSLVPDYRVNCPGAALVKNIALVDFSTVGVFRPNAGNTSIVVEPIL